MIKIFSHHENVIRNRGRLGDHFKSLLLTVGMFSKCLLDLLWGEDKRVQVMEVSALFVLEP